MKHLYKVNEIFKSIEGEGIRTGLPCTFIRLYGCNLCCKYCDTRYSCENKEFTLMSKDEIVNKVKELGGSRVTITGGEPLLDLFLNELIIALRKEHIEVNIETNGSLDIQWCLADIITMDYKTSASGMEDRMMLSNLKALKETDVLKFVVGSKHDLDTMKRVIEEYEPECRIYVSPVFGMIEAHELVEYVLENNLDNVTVQVQLHKIIWDPNKRGV